MDRAVTDPLAGTDLGPVDGGVLRGTVFHPDAAGDPVVGIHGITANSASWAAVARTLPDRPFVAPDLRGRGRSNDLPAPFGLVQHADDVARVLDARGIESAVVAGHSMGAFVAVRLAERHPDRVSGLVLVDGGLPLPVPEGVEIDPKVALGPALDRLTMEFPNRDAYRDFFRMHPALGPYWNDDIAGYVDYDLVGEAPHLRASSDPDAILTNFSELDGRDGYREALQAVCVPTTLVRSPRGLFDEVPPLYPDEVIRNWSQELPGMRVVEAPDTNHYTVVLGPAGADVAERIRELG